jgi:hypothetical protein
MKAGAHAIPTIPRAGRCFNCRDLDIDSTRPAEYYCRGLSDRHRHTGSDGGAALRMVGPIIFFAAYRRDKTLTIRDTMEGKFNFKLGTILRHLSAMLLRTTGSPNQMKKSGR